MARRGLIEDQLFEVVLEDSESDHVKGEQLIGTCKSF